MVVCATTNIHKVVTIDRFMRYGGSDYAQMCMHFCGSPELSHFKASIMFGVLRSASSFVNYIQYTLSIIEALK